MILCIRHLSLLNNILPHLLQIFSNKKSVTVEAYLPSLIPIPLSNTIMNLMLLITVRVFVFPIYLYIPKYCF